MDDREPSRTALAAAAYRAAHQTVDGAGIFADPLARTILGANANTIIAMFKAADPAQKRMRIFIAARSRFAEDCLARAVARGVRQAVILGAGLDTFALRNPNSEHGLRVIEVDHPASQAWKRKRLAEMGLALPASLTFAPVDMERQDLSAGLASAGFQPDRPAFFHWLGVVLYLPRAAVTATLQFISRVLRSEVVFDYTEPWTAIPKAAGPTSPSSPHVLPPSASRGSPISIRLRSRPSSVRTASASRRISALRTSPLAILGRPRRRPRKAPDHM
jgi:methyltransferase (TIGR00027 family)